MWTGKFQDLQKILEIQALKFVSVKTYRRRPPEGRWIGGRAVGGRATGGLGRAGGLAMGGSGRTGLSGRSGRSGLSGRPTFMLL